jgi:hypothetical protein
MRKLLFLAAALILTITGAVNAQGKGFGLGVVLGEPTGIAGKYWTSYDNAISFGLGYSFVSKNSRVNLHVDYLFHNNEKIQAPEKLVLFYGVGARIKSVENSDNSFGMRGVVGIDWFIRNAPIDVFVEVAPVFKLIPQTGVDLDAGIGIRFFFD